MGLFVDGHSKVDREALRTYVRERLWVLASRFATLETADRYRTFWHTLHQLIGQLPDKTEREEYARAELQLKSLPQYCETWVETAVDTPERLDFFVATKAKEIGSGDTVKDYYWALNIRHDQLVGLVRVLEALLGHMEKWVTMKAAQVVEDPVFAGMTEHSVEDQVYFEAEKVHQEREAVMSKT